MSTWRSVVVVRTSAWAQASLVAGIKHLPVDLSASPVRSS